MQFRKQQLELDVEKWTGSKLGKEYVKGLYCHPAYLTYMQGSIQFSCSVMPDYLRPHEPAACQASLSITNSRSPPKPMSIKLVMPSNHLILCCPLLLLPESCPASGSFQMSQLFASRGQSIGVPASTSVFPMNTQD